MKALYKCVSSFVDTSTTETTRLSIHNDFFTDKVSLQTEWLLNSCLYVYVLVSFLFFGMRLVHNMPHLVCVRACVRTTYIVQKPIRRVRMET